MWVCFLPSGDRQLLNKLCDDLVNFKVSVDDILKDEEKVVSSTDSTPVKRKQSSKIKSKLPPKKCKVHKSKKTNSEIIDDMSRARELFGVNPIEVSDAEPSMATKLKEALEEIARLKKRGHVSYIYCELDKCKYNFNIGSNSRAIICLKDLLGKQVLLVS